MANEKQQQDDPLGVEAFYERRLADEWRAVGGIVNGRIFSHYLLPGLGGDSLSVWRHLVEALKAQVPPPVVEDPAAISIDEMLWHLNEMRSRDGGDVPVRIDVDGRAFNITKVTKKREALLTVRQESAP